VLNWSASLPTAVLLAPPIFDSNALVPKAVLQVPVVLALKAL